MGIDGGYVNMEAGMVRHFERHVGGQVEFARFSFSETAGLGSGWIER